MTSDPTAYAQQIGFTFSQKVETAAITCEQRIRDLCTAELCPNYDTNWACPPAAPSVDEVAARVARFSHAIIVQSCYTPFDTTDEQAVALKGVEHNQRLDDLARWLRKDHDEVLELTTGGCGICDVCTYPDAPCRNPELKRESISGFGIDLQGLCESIDMEYTFIPSTLRLMGIILY